MLHSRHNERRQAEELLRQSEERFRRAIVETTPECVKLVSADGTLLLMNSSGLRMLGARRAEEVVGKSIYNLVVPEDRERYQMFNESICRGTGFTPIPDYWAGQQTAAHGNPLCTFAQPRWDSRPSCSDRRHFRAHKGGSGAAEKRAAPTRVVTEAAPIMVWMSGLDKLCYYFNKGWL